MVKRKINRFEHRLELFSAECRLCQMTERVLRKSLRLRPAIDFIVHKASECVDGSCCTLAADYGVYAVPSIVVDGKLVKVGVIKDFEEISPYLKS